MKKRNGEYILEKKVGSGAFGEVYCASKSNDSELFAVKMISKDRLSARSKSYLEREIEILQRLKNFHIIKLVDLKVSGHNYYLIFEYCNGGDLLKYKNDHGGKLDESKARSILSQIVDGLSAIYSLGGIHRDIKLPNILINYPTNEAREKDQPILKICDFGFLLVLDVKNVLFFGSCVRCYKVCVTVLYI